MVMVMKTLVLSLVVMMMMKNVVSESITTTATCPPRVVCYMTNWAVYRHALGRFTALNIPPHLCTHLHYAFGSIDSNQRLGPSDGHADFTLKGYQHFAELKKHNPALKTIITLGGTAIVQQRLEDIANDAVKMQRFVKNSMDFMRMHKFDGIEVDWQSPSSAEDHVRLVEALSTAFKTVGRRQTRGLKPFLLSVTLPANLTQLQSQFDVKRAAQAADYIVSLQYRYHFPTANITGHHAPYATIPSSDPDLNMRSASLMYRTLGVRPDKLVFGVPAFGITFTLENSANNRLSSAATGPGKAGKITNSPGTLSFHEICENVALNDWQAVREYPRAMGPYALQQNQWVAYDDEEMMEIKGNFIRETGLGGAAVWSLSQDDFRGFCTGVQFPLIQALKRGIYGGSNFEPTTTPQPPSTPKYDNRRIFVCPGDGNFAKRDDCTKFYFCKNGTFEELACPSNETFSVLESKCSSEAVCINKDPATVGKLPATPMPSLTTSSPNEASSENTPLEAVSVESPARAQSTGAASAGGVIEHNDNVVASSTQQRNDEISEIMRLLALVRQFNDKSSFRAENTRTVVSEVSDPHTPGDQQFTISTPNQAFTPMKVRVTVEVTPSIN